MGKRKDDPSNLLRKLAGTRTSYADWNETVADDVNSASDRTAALVLSSLVEEGLRVAIEANLHNHMGSDEVAALFNEAGIASDFSRKIHLARILKIIEPKTKVDLNSIRDIRNAFAHCQIGISFATKEVSDVCMAMYLPAQLVAKETGAPLPLGGARQRFSVTCIYFSTELLTKHLICYGRA